MSRKKPRPRDIISTIYEEEGFYEVEHGSGPESGYFDRLVLSDGRREIVVGILSEEAFAARGAIQDALLQAEKLKGKFNGVILAIPRKYQKAVDENVLALHGFGLLIYDILGAEEVIPPKIREFDQAIMGEGHRPEERRIEEEELIRLRREFSRILKVLEEMETRLDRLEKEQNKLMARISGVESKIESLKRTEQRMEEAKAASGVINGGKSGSKSLPPYLVNNPWVEILSRRE
ncbi:MAG: hypothetical protein RMI78_00040 [Nitrososphaerota archaeon]|nr:hypothetical protein [Nitrososphaerota archaeon]